MRSTVTGKTRVARRDRDCDLDDIRRRNARARECRSIARVERAASKYPERRHRRRWQDAAAPDPTDLRGKLNALYEV